MVLTSWRFQDARGNVVDRTASVSATTWAGTVATGGTVRVNGTVDGLQTFGVASLAVPARSWAGKIAPKAHTVIPTTLPFRVPGEHQHHYGHQCVLSRAGESPQEDPRRLVLPEVAGDGKPVQSCPGT